ncbi:MAG: PH domain-containing protein [Pseudomonadota bacterium]
MSEVDIASVPSVKRTEAAVSTAVKTAAPTDLPEPQRTAPLSVVLGLLGSLQNAIIPVLLVAFGNRGEGYAMAAALGIGALIVIAGSAISYLRWRRLTYTIGEQDIRVESGIISRAARSVPFERIQDVSLEQKLLPRIFGLVAVKFETGAGGGEDLSLAYLTEDEGERLRQVVRERRAQGAATQPSANAGDTGEVAVAAIQEESAETLFAMDTKRILTFGVFSFSLAVVAVIGGVTQQFDFLLPFDLWDFDAWEERLVGQSDALAALGPSAQIAGGVIAALSLITLGFVTGLVRTALREWDFLLERTARGFRRRRGLLTKTDVVMPVHRVQGIKIGTRFIRYRFGWHGLKFISLARDAGAANHDVAPFAQLDEIAPIVEQAGFHMPGEDADWHRATRKYMVDNAVIESSFFLLVAIPVAIFAPPLFVLIPLGLAAITAFANVYAWKFHRHALDDSQIMATRGLFAPKSTIATRLKLHSVEVSQGPIAQRRGYASLHFGLAGGTFSIPGIPVERARAVRAAVLETITGTDFSQLEHA